MPEDTDGLYGELNLKECDTTSIRKLVCAIFTEALSEAALLVEWADHISVGTAGEQLRVTSANFLETHENLSLFSRSPKATELLDWLQGFTPQVEAEEYWMKLDDYLEESRYAVVIAKEFLQ